MIMVISSLICICERVHQLLKQDFPSPVILLGGTMIYCSAFCWRDWALKWRELPEAQLPTNRLLTVFQSLTVAYFFSLRLRLFFVGGAPGILKLEHKSFIRFTVMAKTLVAAINTNIKHLPWPLMSSKGIWFKMSSAIFYWRLEKKE